jgi:hypothetical protein
VRKLLFLINNTPKLTRREKRREVLLNHHPSVRISDTQAFIDTRDQDLHAYEDRLTIENNSFAQNQKIHDDLVVPICC